MAIPSPAPGDLPEAALDAIRRTLSGRIIWCPLPPPFDRLFALRRQEEFALLARLGWPLLALMILVIAAGSWLMFHAELQGGDARYWWPGLALETLTLGVLIGMLQHPRLLPHYQRVVALGGAFNLAIPVLGTMIMRAPHLVQVTSYLCLLIINIQILALRLRCRRQRNALPAVPRWVCSADSGGVAVPTGSWSPGCSAAVWP